MYLQHIIEQIESSNQTSCYDLPETLLNRVAEIMRFDEVTILPICLVKTEELCQMFSAILDAHFSWKGVLSW